MTPLKLVPRNQWIDEVVHDLMLFGLERQDAAQLAVLAYEVKKMREKLSDILERVKDDIAR